MRYLLLLTAFVFLSCQPEKNRTASPSDFIPRDTRALLVIHDMERFRSDFRNNTLLAAFREGEGQPELLRALEEILPLELENGSLIAFRSTDRKSVV